MDSWQNIAQRLGFLSVADLLCVCVLIALLIVAIYSFVSRRRERRDTMGAPYFVVRPPNADSSIFLLIVVACNLIIILFIWTGQTTVEFWVRRWIPLRMPGANVMVIAAFVLSILLITGYGSRLTVQSDFLEYSSPFKKKRTYRLYEIGRIERIALQSTQASASTARLLRYRFLDANGKLMFMLDETCINLDKFWDAVIRYTPIRSFYDCNQKRELELVSDYSEKKRRYGLRKDDMPTAGIWFAMAYGRWVKLLFLICTAFFVVTTILMIIVFAEDPTAWIGALIFLFFALLCLFGAFVAFRWLVVVVDEKVFLFKSFRSRSKPKIIPVSSITEARRAQDGSLKLYVQSKKVLGLDPMVANRQLFIVYLRDRGIPMPDRVNPGVGEL